MPNGRIMRAHHSDDPAFSVITVDRGGTGVYTVLCFPEPANDVIVYPNGVIYPVNERSPIHQEVLRIVAENV